MIKYIDIKIKILEIGIKFRNWNSRELFKNWGFKFQ